MWYIVIGILFIGVLAAITGYFHNRRLEKMVERGELQAMPEPGEIQEECCGAHEVCEKDSLLAAVSKQIEYYDDEELDRFRGTASNGYNEAGINEFREILYTLQETDVAGWIRSLQLRGIELPDEIKDEAFLILGERRIHA